MPAYQPPVSNFVPSVDIDPLAVRANPLGNRLGSFYRQGPRGSNVYLLTAGTATLTEPYDPDHTLVRRTLHGGHFHEVTTTEQTAIQNAAVGGTFYPFDARVWPGLVWWIAADQLGLTDGQTVTSWPDISGRYGPLTGTSPPIFVASGINGLPSVRFSGGTYLSVRFNAGTPPPYTAFMVYAYTSGTNPVLLDGPPDGGVLNSTARALLVTSTGILVVDRTFTVASQFLYTTAIPSGTVLTTVRCDQSGNLDVRTNGVAQTGTVSMTSGAAEAFRREPPLFRGFTLGQRADGAQSMNGDVAEIALYNQYLPLDEVSALEADLIEKYT